MSTLAIFGGAPVRSGPVPPWPQLGEAEVAAALEVVRDGQLGRIARLGDTGKNRTDTLREAWLQAYPGKAYAIPCASCCAALEMAVRNAGLAPGDEVITTPTTWVSPALAPLQVGAKVVFADVRPEDYCLDPQAVAAAVTPRTRAIIVVHIGGYCCRMEAILEIAQKHRLKVIEDCAQAQGSIYHGRHVGAWGDYGCYSFDLGKLMPAGEGGMFVCDDDALGEWVYGSLGHAGAQINRLSQGRQRDAWNYRMTEIQAAILLAQLPRMEAQKQARIRNAARLRARLAEIAGIRNVPAEPDQNYYTFHFQYDRAHFHNVPKGKFMAALFRETNIRPFSSPSHQEPVYRSPYFRAHDDYRGVRCPVAERAYAEEAVGITATSTLLGEPSDMDAIADAILKIQQHADELHALPDPAGH